MTLAPKPAMRPIWVFLTLSLLGCAILTAHPVSTHAQKAVEAIQQLRAIGLPASNDLDAGPPAKVPGLLRTLNQELKALIIEDLNDQNRHAVPNEAEVLDQLTAAGWEEIPSHKWSAYGEIRQIKFDWRPGYEPGILIVSTQLWIPCGSSDPDSAIYVFRGVARQWNLVLAAESDFDPAGEKDETGLQYQVSPPDSRGDWFLVVAHVPPSCRRVHNVLRYKALRPGANAEEPTVLLSERQTISPFFEPAFKIRVEEDWMSVTQGRTRKLDGELGIAIARYQIDDHQVQRIAPLALRPEDFLDQWIQMPWDEARRWAKAGLQDWHSQLSSLAPDSTEIESVQHCSATGEGDQNWWIKLSIDQRQNSSMSDEDLYIEVAKRNGAFYLDSVSKNHPAGCPGKTPLMQIIDRNLPDW